MGKKAVLMPEARYTNSTRQRQSDFFKLDPTFSIADEWDFYSTMLEIADSSSGASRSKSVYHEVTVRFKMRRRWKVHGYNIIIYFMVITFLSLTCFALDVEDIGERLNLAVTILLTLVAFQHTVFAKLPNIPYLTFMHKYIIISFVFVCIVITESSFVPLLEETVVDEEDVCIDELVFHLMCLWVGCFHCFGWDISYTLYLRVDGQAIINRKNYQWIAMRFLHWSRKSIHNF